MKLEIGRRDLTIYPEKSCFGDYDGRSVLDIVFIEEVLGLKNDGDFLFLKRKNAIGMSCLDCLQTEKPRGKISNIDYEDGSSDLFLDIPDDMLDTLKKEANLRGISPAHLILDIIKAEVCK